MPKVFSGSVFAKLLMKWYRANARDLPWRHYKDPYKIWVSEIMLQQTTVKTVIGYYERWIRRFPTVKSLADADIQEVLKFWQGLGYYNRARNLHKAAGIVSRDFNGRLPEDPEALRKIPGFGPYTVAAVLSIACGQQLPLVDANVRRVMMRLLNVRGLAEAKLDKEFLLILEQAIPKDCPGDFNQAMMELGALICRSAEPTCNICPVKSCCAAFKAGVQELIPEVKKKNLKEMDVVVAVIRQKGRYLIQQRPSKGLLADLWEFPGGKHEKSDKNLKNALKREIFEELGCQAKVGRSVAQVTHFYTEFKVRLHAYECLLGDDIAETERLKFVSLDDLERYPMPSGSAKILEKIKKTL